MASMRTTSNTENSKTVFERTSDYTIVFNTKKKYVKLKKNIEKNRLRCINFIIIIIKDDYN